MKRAWFAVRVRDPANRGRVRGWARALPALAIACLCPIPAYAQAATGAEGNNLGWIAAGLLAVFAASVGAVLIHQNAGRRRGGERDLLHAMVDERPDAVLMTGPSGQGVTASSEWRRLVGDDLASPIAALATRFRAAEEGDAIDRLRTAAASGSSASALLRATVSDGAPHRLSVRPVAGRNGFAVWKLEPMALAGSVEDNIRREQERTAAFIADGPVGFYSIDQDGVFGYVDQTFAAWLDSTPKKLCGKNIWAFVADADGNTGAESHFDLDIAAPQVELLFRGANGRQWQASVDQAVVPADETGGFHTRSIVRALPEEGLAQLSRADLGGVFADAPIAISILDTDGKVHAFNAAFARAVPAAATETAEPAFSALFEEHERERIDAWLTDVGSATSNPTPLNAKLGGGDGAAVSLTASRLGGADAGGDVMVVYMLDLSAEADIDQRLLQSQKMELVGQLAGGIAHDFNNLLTAMIGFCDLLLLRHSPKDQSFADIMQIKQNANRAANLVRQLLAFSRRQTLQPKVLNPTDVLAELSHLLRRLIGARTDLEITHGRDTGLVKVDQGQFEQVVINLAVNARDAMPDGGSLTIRTGDVAAGDPRIADYADLPDGDYVTVEVIDTGHGIPPEHLEKIYEPFFTTKEVGSGTGLGLATVYGIIKQTGGHIFVDSAPGEGAKFTIFLHKHKAGDEAADESSGGVEEKPHRDLTGAGTVLLVEDEDAVRMFGARALRNKGYHVIEARNGDGALEVLDRGTDHIDLVITYVVMPGIDGPALVRRVRQTHPDMKVIFISGYTEDTFRKRLDDGARLEFLSKPFTLQQLAGKVKEVMHAEQSLADAGSPADA